MALAEEERDTCPSCGYPKAWCRGAGSQVTDYEIAQETCQATYRLAMFRESDEWKKRHPASQAATQASAHFREGYEPELEAGLDLAGEQQDPADDESGDRETRPEDA